MKIIYWYFKWYMGVNSFLSLHWPMFRRPWVEMKQKYVNIWTYFKYNNKTFVKWITSEKIKNLLTDSSEVQRFLVLFVPFGTTGSICSNNNIGSISSPNLSETSFCCCCDFELWTGLILLLIPYHFRRKVSRGIGRSLTKSDNGI